MFHFSFSPSVSLNSSFFQLFGFLHALSSVLPAYPAGFGEVGRIDRANILLSNWIQIGLRLCILCDRFHVNLMRTLFISARAEFLPRSSTMYVYCTVLLLLLSDILYVWAVLLSPALYLRPDPIAPKKRPTPCGG